MPFISFNGQIIEQNQLHFYDVERFRVADACFESMLYLNKEIPLLTFHQERLNKTCSLLGFEACEISLLAIQELVAKNQLDSSKARIRLSIVRKEGLNYKPYGTATQVLIEASKLNVLNQPINQLGFYTDLKKTNNGLAAIKSSNALLYVLAQQFAQKKNYDEVLISNETNQWVESSSSNIFVIKNNRIYTSNQDSGCVNGVCRSFLLNFLEVEFVELTDLFIKEADEIFLSNAVQLIQPVFHLDGIALKTTKTEVLIRNLKQQLAY